MLERLGRFAVRRRRRILFATAMLAILSTVWGVGVFGELKSGGFVDTGAESNEATEVLERDLGIRDPNLIFMVDTHGRSVDDPTVEREGIALAEALTKDERIDDVVAYWWLDDGAPLRSNDGQKALVMAHVTGDDEEVVAATTAELVAANEKDVFNEDKTSRLTISAGGQTALFNEIGERVESDLAKAEAIALPIVLLLLVVVFGGLVAASLPVAIGVLAILGSLGILHGFTLFTDVSVFSINLVTMLGLGLGIDYALFIVSRYREEVRKGLERDDAIVHSVATAGRTVVFSALVIAASLAALLVFPMFFLRSFAYAGISVVALAALTSILFLPALLSVLGPRIDRFTLLRRTPPEQGSGFWGRLARFVMKRPLSVVALTLAFLLLLGAPFLGVKWGLTDDRELPPGSAVRDVSDSLRNDFNGYDLSTLTVVAPGSGINEAAAVEYATAISRLENVERVDAATGTYLDGTLIAPPSSSSLRLASTSTRAFTVVSTQDPSSPAATNLANELRSTPAPFETLVTGQPAVQLDVNGPLRNNLVPAFAVIVIASLLIIFLMTGSVLLPIKAVIIATLSLTAAFGALVWIFQDGHLSGLLNFTPTGTIDATNVVIMFCIAFGLSMDYEVFLLSRIKEEHDRSGNTEAAVAAGLERTGRLITAAALLIAIVFASFSTSGVTSVKMIGVGLAVAVLMDATIIRGALVPATMRLFGEANWWAPAPLKRLHARFGLRDG